MKNHLLKNSKLLIRGPGDNYEVFLTNITILRKKDNNDSIRKEVQDFRKKYIIMTRSVDANRGHCEENITFTDIQNTSKTDNKFREK